MTRIDTTATPRPDISTLLHLKAFANIVAKGDEMLREARVTVMPSFGRAPLHIEETVVGKVGKDNNQQISSALFDQWRVINFGHVPVKMDMRTTANLLCIQSFFKTFPSKLWKRRKKHIGRCGGLAFLGDKKCFKARGIVMFVGQ